MRTRFIALIFAPWAIARAQQPASGARAAQLVGIVTDSITGRSLAGVRISVDGSQVSATTDSTGRYRLVTVDPGSHLVRYRALGYQPANVALQFNAGGQVEWSQALAPVPVRLSREVVRAPARELDLGLAGFYHRRGLGFGQFMTREDWNRFAPRDLVSVIRRFHSLEVKITASGPLILSTRGDIVRESQGEGLQPAKCAMRVGLDGQLLPASMSIDAIPVDQVQAIEVYAGPATIPPEFNSSMSGAPPAALNPNHDPSQVAGGFPEPETNAYCGLVMFWLR
ncbi:MAG TPA: carboxypeptidase regulatory-like domain-containing protein [Gemmatimonadaceae bacterium]|nr:carboxypeptidase regulatory-like domain-containing protein [Gemmatimonadaceae bacterium]